MKLSNFKFDRIVKRRLHDLAYASVDVTKGWWIFGTTIRNVGITATVIGGRCLSWQFADTGFYTPGLQAEALYEEYLDATE